MTFAAVLFCLHFKIIRTFAEPNIPIMTESEAIIARHSVRQYLDKPIEAEKIEAIQECIDHCNREGGVHIQLIANEPKAFSSLIAKYGRFRNVNNYIAVVAPKGRQGSVAAGYWGERLVLALQMLDLRTCWVGASYKKDMSLFRIGADEVPDAINNAVSFPIVISCPSARTPVLSSPMPTASTLPPVIVTLPIPSSSSLLA